jgi:arsenite-transporting ATPase
MAVRAARAGWRTLVISTDPAPSLGDALGRRLGAVPRAVPGVPGLHAVEIDAAAALRRWIEARREFLETIALRGTWLDREDVARLLELSLPGIDEVAGMLEVTTLGGDPAYDQIIVDTAPTGHLLRMLGMPAVFGRLAGVFDQMQGRHRAVADALGGWTPDGADRLIQEIDRHADAARALLQDAGSTRLSWVTLPEPMAVAETADAVVALQDGGLLVDALIVNRLTPARREPCRWCRTRRALETRTVTKLLKMRQVRGIDVLSVPALDKEPRGIEALAAVARMMDRPFRPAAASGGAPALVIGALPAADTGPAPPIVTAESRLVLFGGKGGVGKTTCAAATALELAHADRARRVLLVSTDPAHSLGDALGETVSDTGRSPRRGPSNLIVRELDARHAFDALRDQYAERIDRLLTRLIGAPAIALTQDRQVVQDLFELAPPGIDELVAVMDVTETLASESREKCSSILVVDTAPTGHALRLLEMPSLVQDWVKALMAILLKYQEVAGLGEAGTSLLRLSRELGRLRELLTDPARTRFVVVTRPAALPRAETLRLLDRLAALTINVPAVIINAAGAGTCRSCRVQQAAEQREIQALRRAVRKKGHRTAAPAIVLAPAVLPSPHGPKHLRAWRKTWVM